MAEQRITVNKHSSCPERVTDENCDCGGKHPVAPPPSAWLPAWILEELGDEPTETA